MNLILDETVLQKINTLSVREYETFIALGEGKTREEITKIPGRYCSPKTVDTYISNIKNKLQLPDAYKVRTISTRYIIYVEQNNLVREVQPKHFELKVAV